MADFRNNFNITITIDAGTTRKVEPAQLAELMREAWNLTTGIDTLTKWGKNPDKEEFTTGIRYRSFQINVTPRKNG